MTKKRKQPSESSSDSGLDDLNGAAANAPQSKVKVDPTYGQRSALPSNEDGNFDEAESTEEALAYLRDVRTEASGIPSLLTAPNANQLKDEGSSSAALYADYPRAYYSDGAYVAVPTLSSIDPPHQSGKDPPPLDPQEAYYAALLCRFHTLRSNLSSTSSPPSSPIGAHQPDARALLLSKRQTSQWRGKLLKTAPTTRLLTQLDQETVVFGLEVLGEVLTPGNLHVRRQCKYLGAWGWGLLGRCREVGCLGSEDVGVLRALGKQAAWVGRRICVEGMQQGGVEEESGTGFEEKDGGAEVDGHLPAEENANDEVNRDDIESDGERQPALQNGDPSMDNEGGEGEDVEARRNRLLASLGMHVVEGTDEREVNIDPSCEGVSGKVIETEGKRSPTGIDGVAHQSDALEQTPKAEMLATADAMVTIVGEVYGQKDLLDGRVLWDEM